jgi:hypothetical protein
LTASNGYSIYVFAEPPRKRRLGSVEVIAYKRGDAVYYDAPATVTESSIQSDLGALGEISLTFQRSNQPATGHCGKQKVQFDSGHYEGRFEFHGEEGYASAEATSIPGNVDLLLAEFCGESIVGGSFGRSRGAELYVRNPGLGPRLSVRKARPGAAAEITARTQEYSNGISIERVTALWMPGKDFSYDRHLRSATVRPPAPFGGSARFDLGKKAGQRWSGDLTVDFPGWSDAPLTGPSLRAYLTPSE